MIINNRAFFYDGPERSACVKSIKSSHWLQSKKSDFHEEFLPLDVSFTTRQQKTDLKVTNIHFGMY